MKDLIDTSIFEDIASNLCTKQYACEFMENESSGLSFYVGSVMEDQNAFVQKVFGEFLPALRDALKKQGYTVAKAPRVSQGNVVFDLIGSGFYAPLANLRDGYANQRDYIQRALDLIGGDKVSKTDLREAISLLQAIDANGLERSEVSDAVNEEVPV